MSSKEIRKKFLEFFKSKGHEIVPSDSLVREQDPTVLFTSAGMNQFKEQFLGHNVTYKRAASSQKCLRTADLDKVGETPSHHTFFEMLGNFSFGDYFKEEAILWAWEFMTKVLGIKEEKLLVSVYKDDKESYKIWRDLVKVPEKKIMKFGAKENFWPSNAPKLGPNGPCGPCSEIFYDGGSDNLVEVWNLVFTQFDRKEGGKLNPLPNKNIDTGMGLERVTAVMQGVKTNFETDLFAPIIEELKKHNPFLKPGNTYNVIADHVRAVTFAICDGVAPSNEERGYIIRKLIRRAYLRGKAEKPFLYNIVPKVVEIMKDTYPELLQKREGISFIVKEEEERFRHTLSVAMPNLTEALKAAKGNVLNGEKIFKLVDTYGLPLEVIENEAGKRKIKLDIAGFNELMEERKALSRKKSKIEGDVFGLDMFAKLAPELPYSDKLPLKAEIAFISEIKKKEAKKASYTRKASKGAIVRIMTNPQSSLFYPEAGGQVGDRGVIRGEKSRLQILNTIRVGNKTFHLVEVVEGEINLGDSVEISLNTERKRNIAKNHTATHLLQSALRKVLGEHVHQAGSLVNEDRLRFDFTHMKKMTEREIEKVEAIVNDYIKKGVFVRKAEKPLDEARKDGAIALFGEKYADKVTVISAGDFSKEVCGGTHVDNTKDIELFKITRESSVASGVRRIEACTADRARKWADESEKQKAKNEKLLERKVEEKKSAKQKLKKAEENIDAIIKKAKDIKGVKIIIEEVKSVDLGILRRLADGIKEKEKSSFIMLGSKDGGRANLVLRLSEDLVSKGANASDMIKPMAKIIGGSGGGRLDFAQAGGKEPLKLSKAFKIAEKAATDIIEGVSK